MVLEQVMWKQKFAEEEEEEEEEDDDDDDGYGPSEDEDDDYYVNNFTERKKRLKRLKSKKKKGNFQDPLVVFGWDIMLMILNHLDARSVALSLMVSRSWNGVASSDAIWSKKTERPNIKILSIVLICFLWMIHKKTLTKCEELWAGKAHIPQVSQTRGLSKLAAFSLSIMDGKRRRIMKEDLWDHAWEFHFNKLAPVYWRNLDPYWKGTGPPMRRYFHPDGSQTADPGDGVWGGHESCYSIVTSFLADGKIREHYVRINRWPWMSITRKQDWGWKMSNHLYCYTSVPDADKEGGTGPVFWYAE